MVNFTQKLEANIRQPWAAHYIEYKGLQKVIKSLPREASTSRCRRWLFPLPEGEGRSRRRAASSARCARSAEGERLYVEELQRQSAS